MSFYTLTWLQVQELLKCNKKGIIIPIGSTEEHGYHLPLSTDSIIAEKLAEELSKRLNLPYVPTIFYGVCRTTALYPGTITISVHSLKNLVNDIVYSLYTQGFEKFFIITGHGGDAHVVALEEISRQLKQEKDIDVYVIKPYEIDVSDLVDTKDIHAGEVETSLMLYLCPDLVHMQKAKKEAIPSMNSAFYTPLRKRPTPSGTFGDPTKASRDKGKQIFERYVKKIGEFISQILS